MANLSKYLEQNKELAGARLCVVSLQNKKEKADVMESGQGFRGKKKVLRYTLDGGQGVVVLGYPIQLQK